jgi:TetR/AcrR family transcriptional regulator, cholesterol catabolism regulator
MARRRTADGESTKIYKELSSGKTARFDQKLVFLLTRSAQVFAEQGYERTSIRQVATAAGVSLAGLYHYVKSKDELLFFIQYHTFGMLTEGLEGVLAQPAAPEAHLEQMVSNHVRYLVEHLPELKVCATELDSLQGELYDQVLVRRQRYFELTRQILKKLKAQDHDSRVDPNLGALYLFGMLNWIVMWFDPKRNDPVELSRSLAEFFLAGYRNASAAASGRDKTEE